MITNIAQFLTGSAERVPDKLAFSDGTRSLTYRELDHRARSAATEIIRRFPVGSKVMVMMNRSADMIAALFGVWYAGCCAVPIDTSLPLARIVMMAQKSDAAAMIYDGKYGTIAEKLEGVTAMDYARICDRARDDRAIGEIQKKTFDSDSAYIIFTSGSSGIPKGVVSSHRCAINFASALSEELAYGQDFVLAGQTPLYYIASLHDIMPAVKLGLSVYLIPNEILLFPIKIIDFLSKYNVSVLSVVPSVLSRIASCIDFSRHPLPFLRYILYGGEELSAEKLMLLQKGLPHTVVCCCYGLTEVTTTCCLWKSISRPLQAGEQIPIGAPLKNARIYLIDEAGQESFEEGELFISGACVADGYYNDRELTSKAFCQNPLHDRYMETVYRTGDMARYNEYGELVFMGRGDDQIKIGGHRVELRDIEAVALRNPSVESVCCIFMKDRGRVSLCYSGEIDKDALRSFLAIHLPYYMLPSRLIHLKQMPLFSTGKINRKEVESIARKAENI